MHTAVYSSHAIAVAAIPQSVDARAMKASNRPSRSGLSKWVSVKVWANKGTSRNGDWSKVM